MKQLEEVTVMVGGHEFRLQVEPDEIAHVHAAAEQVTQRLRKLGEKAGSASPAKVATMVAFQFACDLSIANELLDEAEKLHEQTRQQREAIERLELLLSRVDDALVV
jgi:cell division protein ZapA (FtsZ GTPase activity inhibitor)